MNLCIFVCVDPDLSVSGHHSSQRARALVGVAQSAGVLSRAPNGAGSVPGEGTCLGCRFRSQSRCMWKASNRCFSLHIDVSLSFSPLLSLKSIHVSLSED